MVQKAREIIVDQAQTRISNWTNHQKKKIIKRNLRRTASKVISCDRCLKCRLDLVVDPIDDHNCTVGTNAAAQNGGVTSPPSTLSVSDLRY